MGGENTEDLSLYRDFFNSSSDLMSIAGFDGRLRLVNPAWERVLGYTAEELIGIVPLDLIHPEDRAAAEAAGAKLRAGAKVTANEVRVRCKDGTYRWVSWRSTTDSARQLYLSSACDTTPFKLTETALKESQANLRRLLEQAPVPIGIRGLDGDLRFINKKFEQTFGYKAEEIFTFQDWVSRAYPDPVYLQRARDRWEASLEAAKRSASGDISAAEYDIVCKDGSVKTINLYGLITAEKELICTFEDVTARSAQQKALEQSERTMRKILDLAPMSMAIVTLEGKIEYINHKAEETFGYPNSEIPTMDAWWRLAYPDEAYRREVTERWMGRVYKAFEQKTEIDGGEYEVTCKGGVVKTCHIFGVIAADKVFVLFDDITERARAERALRESEATLRRVLDQTPMAMGIHSAEGKVEYLNAKFTQTFGYRLEDVPDREAWAARVAPDPAYRAELGARWAGALKRAAESDGQIQGEAYRLACKDGAVKDVFIFGVLSAGKAIVMFDDITERLKAERALRDSERTLRRVLEQAPTAIAIHDMGGRIEFINRKFSDTFGYRHEDIPTLESWVNQAYPDPAYREKLVGIWGEWIENSVRTGREMTGGEFQVVCKDGGVKTAFITGIVTPDRKVLSLLDDVTSRVEAERALRERESLYRALVETTRTGYVVIDGHGKVLDANREYVRLTGHTDLKEIMGRNVRDWVVPDNRLKNDEAVAQCARDGHIRNFEVDYLGKAGAVVPVEINATVVSRNGMPQILALCRDISKRRQIEAELRGLNLGLEKRVAERTAELTAANVELTTEIEQRRLAEESRKKLQEELLQSQKMEVVGRLSGGIAHDFNNILGAISGYAEFLLKSMPEGAPARDDLSEILRETERGSLLTRQLMAISRKQPVETRVLALNPLVEDSCRMLCRLVGPGVRIEQSLAQQLEPVKADPGQVSQVLMNLIINARDAMPDGGRIKVATANEDIGPETPGLRLSPPPGRYAALTVSDTGTGMPPETAVHIFDPFFTTKEKGKGTGLGLSTVYGIVFQAGGGIALDTAPGKGSTFKIYFPATKERA
ncbi:MAG: PAS domain S-box protein [Elusimicrobiales bacterium]